VAFEKGLFAGKAAFVAGGTSGIGLGIAKGLAKLGARVSIVGRNLDKAEAAAQSIGSGLAIAYACDVRNFQDVTNVLERAAEAHGALDIIVASAAGNFGAPALGMSANGFRVIVDIDLNGTFNVFRASYVFLRRPGASLVAITAGQAVNPMPFQAHVCAAKSGVNQLVRVLAMEWGPAGVRVNGVSPGPIAGTEGMDRVELNEETSNIFKARLALRRFGTVEDVAHAVSFLCSDAASYVTGTILNCDGGYELGDASERRVSTGPV